MLDGERERFVAERPRTRQLLDRARRSMPNGVPMQWFRETEDHPLLIADEGVGAHFVDADGHRYLDVNIADMSMFCGYAPEPVVRAAAERVARGSQFLLPTEDAIWVAEELARRWELPQWQFTLSASQANTEVIRLARVATGRETILMFDGKYHGHFDQGLVILEDAVCPSRKGAPTFFGGLYLTSIDGDAPNDIWAAGGISGLGGAVVIHWDGSTWSVSPTTAASGPSGSSAISATGPHDVWAVGSVTSDSGLSSSTFVWTAGYSVIQQQDQAIMLNWTGSEWTQVGLPSDPATYALNDVKGFDPSDVWTVGDVIVHLC